MKKIIAVAAAACLGLALVACSPQPAAQQPSTTGQQQGAESASQGSATSGSGSQQAQQSGGITENDARAIALADAGVSEGDVAAMHVSRTNDDGREVFDVEFFAGNVEYDYEILASDGTIIERDFDAEFDFSSGNGGVTYAPALTRDDAMSIALGRVPGATADNARVYYEVDDGRAMYEGEIVFNETEYSFEIDADTGDILEWEEESVWD